MAHPLTPPARHSGARQPMETMMTRQDELRALARMATMSAYTPSVRRSAKASLDSKAPKLATDLADALDRIARLEEALNNAPIPSKYGAGLGEYIRLAQDIYEWKAKARATLQEAPQ